MKDIYIFGGRMMIWRGEGETEERERGLKGDRCGERGSQEREGRGKLGRKGKKEMGG